MEIGEVTPQMKALASYIVVPYLGGGLHRLVRSCRSVDLRTMKLYSECRRALRKREVK